jgi:hypothetical protein
MKIPGKRGESSDEQGSSNDHAEGTPASEIIPITLGVLGIAVVATAVTLAVRSPGVSSETETFDGPAVNVQPTKVERTSARPSDTFLAALLALGGVLVAAGAFYPRIRSVEGPGFKLGLAELSPDAKQKLTEAARHEAEVHGHPDEADEIAGTAEQMLIERVFREGSPGFGMAGYAIPARYQRTYAYGQPLEIPALTENEIREVVTQAANQIVPED